MIQMLITKYFTKHEKLFIINHPMKNLYKLHEQKNLILILNIDEITAAEIIQNINIFIQA